jgi:hypothetical protein
VKTRAIEFLYHLGGARHDIPRCSASPPGVNGLASRGSPSTLTFPPGGQLSHDSCLRAQGQRARELPAIALDAERAVLDQPVEDAADVGSGTAIMVDVVSSRLARSTAARDTPRRSHACAMVTPGTRESLAARTASGGIGRFTRRVSHGWARLDREESRRALPRRVGPGAEGGRERRQDGNGNMPEPNGLNCPQGALLLRGGLPQMPW